MVETDESPQVTPVAEMHRFDERSLAVYLAGNISDFGSIVGVKQFSGGASNPTFLLEAQGPAAKSRYVLRKRPPGNLLPSAHQVDREYKFMEALLGSEVPVPNVRHLCQDPGVIGTDFYVMDYIDGRIFTDAALPDVTRADRTAIMHRYCDVLTDLHKFDYTRSKLADFARPGNFLQRQFKRFVEQYHLAQNEETSASEAFGVMNELIEMLDRKFPEAQASTVFHGDYRFGNIMYAKSGSDVLAVLDWELATIGDPLLDLAYSMLPWYANVTSDGYVSNPGPETGIPSAEDMVRRYCQNTARDGVTGWNFYLAFSLFRLASIAQGIAMRVKSGSMSSSRNMGVGAEDPVNRLAQAALRIIRNSSLETIES